MFFFFLHVCVCVCVFVRGRKRLRRKRGEKEREDAELPSEPRRIIIGYQFATSRTAEKGFPPVERRRDRIDAVATGSRTRPAKSFYPVIFGDSIHSSYAVLARSRVRSTPRALVAQSVVARL